MQVSGRCILRHAAGGESGHQLTNVTALAVTQSSVLIGSIGGLVLEGAINARRSKDKAAIKCSSLRLEQDAIEILQNLPPQKQKTLVRHLEKWASSARKKFINAGDIFASKPPLYSIYPPFQAVTKFEAHARNPVSPHACIEVFPT